MGPSRAINRGAKKAGSAMQRNYSKIIVGPSAVARRFPGGSGFLEVVQSSFLPNDRACPTKCSAYSGIGLPELPGSFPINVLIGALDPDGGLSINHIAGA